MNGTKDNDRCCGHFFVELTGALAEDRSCLKDSFFLWNYRGSIPVITENEV
ncbi:hypothetical protein [Peribacillus simplex]|uniref:hypothetical protein n=1 Tax=Peribacillus simplex TaxID=1478 RepID=UPI001E6298B5|nr:hypothetical protein [Peribacillus simplex]